jgi:hypothetical protein
VFIHGWPGPISTDRSRVMYPASTVATHTFSSVSANFVTSGVSSNLARKLPGLAVHLGMPVNGSFSLRERSRMRGRPRLQGNRVKE